MSSSTSICIFQANRLLHYLIPIQCYHDASNILINKQATVCVHRLYQHGNLREKYQQQTTGNHFPYMDYACN